MSSKIIGAIGEMNFELVRDRICEILAIELANQVQYDLGADITVWKERFSDPSIEELPLIDVQLLSGDYDSNYKSSIGDITFAIDIYEKGVSSGPSGSVVSGDTVSKLALHKALRYVFQIMGFGAYSSLDFPQYQQVVNSHETKRFNIGQLPSEDTNFISMCRIEHSVNMNELFDAGEAGPLNQANTDLKLHETNKGYYYSYVKPTE